MKTTQALVCIQGISSSQRGYLTTRQAMAVGVSKLMLSRMASSGLLERIRYGVYRVAGAPPIREEEVYSVWRALDPACETWERPLDMRDYVAALHTASWLLGMGDLNPEPYVFICPARKQTQSSDLRLIRRRLERDEVQVVQGIPVTSPARTIVDLLEDGQDPSLVGDVLRDALTVYQIDLAELGHKLHSAARLHGMDSSASLIRYMLA